MLTVICIIVASIIIAFIFIPSLLKIKDTKTIVIFSLLLLIGALLNSLNALNIHVPSPLIPLVMILSPLKKILDSWREGGTRK
ncbi:hypothetical protein [Lysinibacillus piscis]|uniref:Holin n=1 Tax=Lysinibacillus piscis TaxID=2518931 RepID=A0ABQ5NL06_9BACI|nr:hypothetical protein [Lysinibacillus sp. KH24]GLC89035.1 hypothetical protein LYSBPC_21620 [Lysinibacillus sp. KH24]